MLQVDFQIQTVKVNDTGEEFVYLVLETRK
jgi:hypothetical protein